MAAKARGSLRRTQTPTAFRTGSRVAHPDWLATVVESADDANDTAVTSTAAPTTAAARLQKLALKHRRLLAIVPVLGMLAGGAVLFQQTGRA